MTPLVLRKNTTINDRLFYRKKSVVTWQNNINNRLYLMFKDWIKLFKEKIIDKLFCSQNFIQKEHNPKKMLFITSIGCLMISLVIHGKTKNCMTLRDEFLLMNSTMFNLGWHHQSTMPTWSWKERKNVISPVIFIGPIICTCLPKHYINNNVIDIL